MCLMAHTLYIRYLKCELKGDSGYILVMVQMNFHEMNSLVEVRTTTNKSGDWADAVLFSFLAFSQTVFYNQKISSPFP